MTHYSPNRLGTKLVDETTIADGRGLIYNSSSGKLEYVTPGSGVGQKTLHLATFQNGTNTHTVTGLNNTSYVTNTNNQSYLCTIDVANLNTVFGAGGWGLYMRTNGSTNGVGTAVTLYSKLTNETDAQDIGERSSVLVQGGVGALAPLTHGPYTSGTVPTSGHKRVRLLVRENAPGTEVYYLGPFIVLEARAI